MENDKIKELITRMIEIDDQLSILKKEKKDLRDSYKTQHAIDLKLVDTAVNAIKKELNGHDIMEVMTIIEPIIR